MDLRSVFNKAGRKSLELALASTAALGVVGGVNDAKAHDSAWPVFYFRVLDKNFNSMTNFNWGERFYVDAMINGMNDLGNISSNRVHNINYEINFSILDGIILNQAILMTNNFWQSKSFTGTGSAKTISNQFDNAGNLYANISLPNPVSNAVYGNDVAVRYVFDTPSVHTNELITIHWVSGNARNANGEIHYIHDELIGNPAYAVGQDITFLLPEPKMPVLFGTGLAALSATGARRRRKDYTNITENLTFNKKGKFRGVRGD